MHYESPSGSAGFAVWAIGIPGCVVRHAHERTAIRLVAEAIAAVEAEEAEKEAPFARVPATEFAYRYV